MERESDSAAAGRARWRQRPELWIPLLILVLFAPFLNKAVHIDDVAFLRLGDMLGWNPLEATPTDYYYQGRVLHDLLPYEATHSVLMPWLLKLLRAIAGEDERGLHAAFLVFPVLALWGLWRLGRALLASSPGRSLLLLVLFAANPAFLVNGHNLMTDVPTLGFLLAGAALLVEGIRRGGALRLWLGSAALTAALFCSYQVGLLLLTFLPLIWVERGRPAGCPSAGGPGRSRRPIALHCLAALALPYLLLFVWLLLVWQRYGLFPLLASRIDASIGSEIARGLIGTTPAEKCLFLLAAIGAAAAPVFVAARAWRFCGRGCRLGMLVLAAVLIPGILVLPAARDFDAWQKGLLAVLALVGGAALLAASGRAAAMANDARLRPAALCLGLWLGFMLLVDIAVLPFGAARYALPALPPLFVLLLAESPESRPLPAWLGGACAAAAVTFGLLAGASDYAYADSYRKMAAETAGVRARGGDRFDVWYIGEWGMRHYFDRAGAQYLPAGSNAPRLGDLVVIPEMPVFWAPDPALQERLEIIGTREFASGVPLRLFNRRSSAGFYCHYWGLLPFAASTAPDEVFTVLRVEAPRPEDVR